MKIRISLCLLLLLGVTVSAFAQPARFIEGEHYRSLETPVRTADDSRIEVIELFWYGCPGCYAFEPLMADWEQQQAADIDHKRLPAAWNPLTEIHAQAFFAAEALDALEQIHDPFFAAYHQQGNRLHNEVAIRDFFESCGISKADFDRVFNSFSVRTRVSQAQRLMAQYGRAQTPSIYVNGKYVVQTGAGGYQQMLEVVDYLISLERG
jgi:thiol:disulfide interchange protein DsbA